MIYAIVIAKLFKNRVECEKFTFCPYINNECFYLILSPQKLQSTYFYAISPLC